MGYSDGLGLECCRGIRNAVQNLVPISEAFWDIGFWHADDIVGLADGADVLSWPARVAGTPLLGTAGVTCPKYRTNYIGSDGRPSVQFTAASLQRFTADAIATSANSPTLFEFVDNSPTTFTTGTLLSHSRATDGAMRRELRSDTVYQAIYDDGAGGTGVIVIPWTTDGVPILGGRQMTTVQFANTTTQIGLDGVSPAAVATGSIFNFNVMTVGGRRSGGAPITLFDGRMRAIGISTQTATPSQLGQIFAFLYGTPIRLWMAGDSITRGEVTPSTNGWRADAWRNVTLGKYRAEFIGDQIVGAGFVHKRNGGVSGNTIAQLAARCTTELGTTLFPNIICLMIGTNNMSTYVPVSTVNEYIALLNLIISLVPTTRILWTTLIPRQDVTLNANTTAFNAELITAVATWAAEHPGTIINGWNAHTAIGGVWNAANYADGIHPNGTGADLILDHPTAGQWQAVQSYLAA